MFHYNDDNIQIFEKKYSIEEIVQLYRDERLIFVRDSKAYVHSNIYYNNKTTQLIEAHRHWSSISAVICFRTTEWRYGCF